MKIKKYKASSLKEAMQQVKDDLGNEAVILSSKKGKKKGILSFLHKPYFEIIAAIEEENEKSNSSSKSMKEDVTLHTKKAYATSEISSNDKEEKLLGEIQELKSIIASSNSTNTNLYLPEPIKQISLLLKQQELEEEIINGMVKHLMMKWYREEGTPSLSMMKAWLKDYMHSQLANVSFGGIHPNTKYVFLFGPTGVGKTTTIAKLAGDMVLQKKKSVAFITLDTYRIAAVEQLKTYANILQAPLKVCYNKEEFIQAKEDLQSYDVIFIDTAGRNFFEKHYVEEIEKFFDFNGQSESFLVLSATSKYTDMIQLMKQFERYPITKMIFTKCDETRFHGPIFNIVQKNKLAISYFTTGQNVPEDIIETNKSAMVDMILGGI